MKSFVLSLSYSLFLLSLFQVVASKTAKSRGECLPVSDEKNVFHCLSHNLATKECEDQHESCNGWARKGECRKNPSFMMSNCRKSCGTCLDLHVGEVQVAPDAAKARAVLERLVATQGYIYAETERNPQVFRKCKNGRLFGLFAVVIVVVIVLCLEGDVLMCADEGSCIINVIYNLTAIVRISQI